MVWEPDLLYGFWKTQKHHQTNFSEYFIVFKWRGAREKPPKIGKNREKYLLGNFIINLNKIRNSENTGKNNEFDYFLVFFHENNWSRSGSQIINFGDFDEFGRVYRKLGLVPNSKRVGPTFAAKCIWSVPRVLKIIDRTCFILVTKMVKYKWD